MHSSYNYNKIFVKYEAQGGVNPNSPLAYALVIGYITCVEQNQPLFCVGFLH